MCLCLPWIRHKRDYAAINCCVHHIAATVGDWLAWVRRICGCLRLAPVIVRIHLRTWDGASLATGMELRRSARELVQRNNATAIDNALSRVSELSTIVAALLTIDCTEHPRLELRPVQQEA